MQLVCKVGTKYSNINDPRHFTDWRDGQVIEDFNDGHVKLGTLASKHHCIIQIPNLDYWTLRGDTNWKSIKLAVYEHKKLLLSTNKQGKYVWEASGAGLFVPKRIRDWIVDYKWLLDNHYITLSQYEDIYNKEKVANIELSILNLMEILKYEENWERLSAEKDQIKGSVESGTYQIGTGGGADYATWTLFQADIGATQDGDLKGEGQDEETAIAGQVVFNHDENGHKFTCTAESGAEHDGTYSGARITCAANDHISFSAIATASEFSKLAIDVSGSNNRGFVASATVDCLVNRLLIKGDADSYNGIQGGNWDENLQIRNCIVYGVGDGGTDSGIGTDATYKNTYLYNNTCIGNYYNIHQVDATPANLTIKNNLCQANSGGADYVNCAGGTNAKNISEDATSPDAAYRSKDLHTNSVFVDYGNDNYKIDKDGDVINLAIIDDGEDLSGTFTDDINHDATWRSDPFDIGASQREAIPSEVTQFIFMD